MRITYAIVVNLPSNVALPRFWELQQSLSNVAAQFDRGDFRLRLEIARVEVENVTPENRASGCEMVRRMSREMLVPALARILGESGLTLEVADTFASVDVIEVENAPNPQTAHGMEGADPSVRCPQCDAAMVMRTGPGSKIFWGCPNYPRCRGTRKISV